MVESPIRREHVFVCWIREQRHLYHEYSQGLFMIWPQGAVAEAGGEAATAQEKSDDWASRVPDGVLIGAAVVGACIGCPIGSAAGGIVVGFLCGFAGALAGEFGVLGIAKVLQGAVEVGFEAARTIRQARAR